MNNFNSTSATKTTIAAFFIAIISMTFATSTQAQNTRTGTTFVKTFHHEDIEPVFDFNAEVEVVSSNRTDVRFLITVNNKHFRALAEAGRYLIERKVVDGQTVYFMPNISREIRINGQIVEDHMTITALVPQYAEATVQSK